MEQQSNTKIWKLIIQTLITILTAIGTTLGVNAAVSSHKSRSLIQGRLFLIGRRCVPARYSLKEQ